MTPSTFAGEWKRSPVVKFRLTSPFSEGLSQASAAALRDCGLPQTAEPWLSFMEFAATDPATASLLEERRLFPVGCLANGSVICIEKQTDRLVILEQDDPDDLWPLNSSLEALYESIALYDAFISEVNHRNPHFSSDFKIPYGMLDTLRDRMTDCDPGAMKEKGFWYCALNALDDSAF